MFGSDFSYQTPITTKYYEVGVFFCIKNRDMKSRINFSLYSNAKNYFHMHLPSFWKKLVSNE